MNKKFVSFLSGILALLTVVGGLDLTGLITLLPDNVAKVFVIGLPALAGIKHLIIDLGDFADDGQINGSFKLLPLLLWLAVGALSFASLACGTGTILKFGKSGIEIIPPATPIVIPVK